MFLFVCLMKNKTIWVILIRDESQLFEYSLDGYKEVDETLKDKCYSFQWSVISSTYVFCVGIVYSCNYEFKPH